MGPVDVVNQALIQIGDGRNTISSIGPPDTSTESQVAAAVYQTQIDALARAAHWNCMRYQGQLTLLKAASGTTANPSGSLPTPPLPWLYEYAYPTDCIKARYVLPLLPPTNLSPPPTTSGAVLPISWYVGTVAFSVATDVDSDDNPIRVILTNMPMAQLVYTKRIKAPDLWDPGFLNAAVSLLAANFVNPINRNGPLYTSLYTIAKAAVMDARISDANEGQNRDTDQNRLPDWIAVRGVQPYAPDGAIYFASWDSLGFPGGFSI